MNKPRSRWCRSVSGTWLAICGGVGVAIGTATHNLALWLAIGVAVGMAIGSVMGRQE